MLFIILTLAILFSCKDSKKNQHKSFIKIANKKTKKDSLQIRFNKNLTFIGETLLNGKTTFIKHTIENYQSDTCGILTYEDYALRNGFEGLKGIDIILKNKEPDTVFVLPPFNYCDDGYSFYFFDTTLPRLFTDSYCCHPDNLFSIGDVDEDGIAEICIFYSSCASRFKALIVYSLKNNTWKEVGRCTFDIAFMYPRKETRVRKIKKGQFEMLEIVDKAENKKWKQFLL